MNALYSIVKKDLEKKIKDGVYKPGEFIPPEQELEAYYRVSRTTVRKAIEMLVSEGYLTIQRGVGTKVALSSLKDHGGGQLSLTEILTAQGMHPDIRDISVRTIKPDEEVARNLDIQLWDDVVEISRVRTADGEPITTNISYIPANLFKGHDIRELEKIQSLYKTLEEKFGIEIVKTEDVISAVAANGKQAKALGVNRNDPILLLERTAFDKNDRPVEWCRITIRGDRYKHIITVRRR